MRPDQEERIGEVVPRAMLQARRSSHWILWFTVFVVVVLLLWAYFAKLDEVTTAPGKVIPSQQIQILQNLEGGIIKNITVKEGDFVDAGQVLINIDDTRFSSPYQEALSRENALKVKLARLQAESEGQGFVLSDELQQIDPDLSKSEIDLYDSRLNELQSQLAILTNQVKQKEHEEKQLRSRETRLKKSYSLVEKELKMTEPLVREGAVSEVELLRLQRAANDLSGELIATQHAIPRAQISVNEAENKIKELKASMRTDILDDLNEAKGDLTTLQQSKVALKDRLTRTAIKSPMKGIIKQIHFNTVGGVIKPGMPIMEIVPLDDTLLIEAQVRPDDIAFLYPGQEARVKVTAYDYSIFSDLPARIEQISADTVTDQQGNSFYEIKVRTDRNYLDRDGKHYQIIPGMNVLVDILTGEKTVMEYIMKPIFKAKSSAMSER